VGHAGRGAVRLFFSLFFCGLGWGEIVLFTFFL
jgi:hypothetical protein